MTTAMFQFRQALDWLKTAYGQQRDRLIAMYGCPKTLTCLNWLTDAENRLNSAITTVNAYYEEAYTRWQYWAGYQCSGSASAWNVTVQQIEADVKYFVARHNGAVEMLESWKKVIDQGERICGCPKGRVNAADNQPQRSRVKKFDVTMPRQLTWNDPDNPKLQVERFNVAGGTTTVAGTVTTEATPEGGTRVLWTMDEQGTLDDGLYRVTMPAYGVVDECGNGLGGDQRFYFHAIFGDFEGDGDVDNYNALQILSAHNIPANYKAEYDYNGDGDVDDDDVLFFFQQLNTVSVQTLPGYDDWLAEQDSELE
jgi:hypothetical protein